MDTANLAYRKLQNLLAAALLLGGLTLLLGLMGWLLAGGAGLVWAVALALITSLAARSLPARLLLAHSGASPLPVRAAPELYQVLTELYRRAGLRHRPTLYYLPSPALNAFAVGHRDDGGIAVSSGLLRTLNLRELAGVLAHEVSHLRHNDTTVMAMADAMARLTFWAAVLGQVVLLLLLPWWLAGELPIPWLLFLAILFAPSASTLLQLALSRNREYAADMEAANLTGDPEGLMSALVKLERFNGGWLRSLFGRTPQLAPPWLRTHPPTEERIQRLQNLAHRRPAATPSELLGRPPFTLRVIPPATRPQRRYWLIRRRWP
ncbi:zinc metalloprotease HtpX [Alkalilimnicola ehrlichii MLHE-1]|uniref:Peptidase M48, Ste24p n=1 Tax=Alkalilimnicola ehrlichii (strain ATCC BAA-1101 / DSM 17681 / MLHE-1) TaxID=187272 RepID=Q0AB83_ALKEH|nr:zinc metalloprotease HtpX [Alkalilimnicola ehrlichii]ABI55904.1 peptidase M48, Ste24p [Alkalilimnicola ehrlichii MLHE-1]